MTLNSHPATPVIEIKSTTPNQRRHLRHEAKNAPRASGTRFGRSAGLAHIKIVVVAFAMGATFAYALARSGVLMSVVIRSQFTFTRFAMLKMFLAAAATSAAVHVFSYNTSRAKFERERKKRSWGDRGLATVSIGGFIQGIGMAAAGSCPGSAMGQVGAEIEGAGYVVVGALCGAGFHSLLDSHLAEAQRRDFKRTFGRWFSSGFLDHYEARGRYDEMACVFIAVLAAVSLALEYAVPWRSDRRGVRGVPVGEALWPPQAAGVVVGMLQFPAFYLLEGAGVCAGFLGTSAAYSIVSAQWMRLVPPESSLREKYSYASRMATSTAFWQVIYVLGAAAGGHLATRAIGLNSANGLNGNEGGGGEAKGVGPALGFLGGFLLLLGARLSGGCPSGHGLSGMSLFSITGYVAVASMFAGAIVASMVLLRVLGEDDFYLR